MTAKPDKEKKTPFDAERAPRYDSTIQAVMPGYQSLHALVKFLLADCLGEAAHLLIAGVGTGLEIEILGSANPGWRFTGFDPSEGMIDQAKARMDRTGLAQRAALVVGAIDDLDPAPAFDAATLLLVMHFLPDNGAKLAMLKGIAKRLKPGAPLVLADLHGASDTARHARLMKVWRHWQLAHGLDPEDVEKGFRFIAKNVHFVPETRLFALLHEAGFTGIEHFHQAFLTGGWLAFRHGRS